MKKEDIKIGIKVTPFQKTVIGFEKDIEEYKNTNDLGKFLKENRYLYVIGYDDYKQVWMLGDMTYNNNEDGDYFNAKDFEPYQEKENGFEIKCLDCGHVGCDLNIVYHGFQFSCPNCGQVYKQ